MIKESEFLIRVCKEAAGLITDDFALSVKGGRGDLVTDFDFKVEKFIIDEIKKEYPTFEIISEEYNPTVKLTENCFVIDPIDGTINFAYGIPLWGIQTACIKNGKTVASVIYLPKLNELYHADDEGAFCNGQKIHVSNTAFDKCLYTLSVRKCGADWEEPPMPIKNFKHLRKIGASSVSAAWVACGRFCGFLIKDYDTPWDYVPGHFLIEQAGGFIHDEPACHAAANSKEFLDALIKEAKTGL